MESDQATEFVRKFRELNSINQKYIHAIQQALVFAQSTPFDNVKKESDLPNNS